MKKKLEIPPIHGQILIGNRRQQATHTLTHTRSSPATDRILFGAFFFLLFLLFLFLLSSHLIVSHVWFEGARAHSATHRHCHNRSIHTNTQVNERTHTHTDTTVAGMFFTYTCAHGFYLHLDIVSSVRFVCCSLFFSPSSSIDTDEILLVRAIWLRCKQPAASAIDPATVLLSVSS